MTEIYYTRTGQTGTPGIQGPVGPAGKDATLPQGLSTSDDPSFDQIYVTNNGNGTNVKIGDDAWIGDVNIANHISIKGFEDQTKGGIVLGSGKTEKISSNATDMNLYANNDIILSPGSTYAYLGPVIPANRIAKMSDITPASVLYYGNFARSTSMSSGGTTSDNLVTWDTTNLSNGMSIDVTDRSKIVFANAGTYNFNFLGQFNFTGGSSDYHITAWYSKNGTNVPSSAFTFTTGSAQNSQVLANIEAPIQVTTGDYIQFHWWSGAAGMSMIATAAGTNPTRPASPSANLTIYNVG
jgi:hypothetical protein